MIPRFLLEAPGTSFPRRARWAIQLGRPGFIALTVIGVCASSRAPFGNATLPFSVGEKLTYEVRVANAAKVGTATMWIEGPVDVRGISTYLLRFDSQILLDSSPRSAVAHRGSIRFGARRSVSLSTSEIL
jgi:hypothetical protein